MKKIIMCSLACFTLNSMLIQADYEDEIAKGKPNIAKLTKTMVKLAEQLMTELPALIKDIAKFPQVVHEDILSLQHGLQEIATLDGQAKNLKIEELFVFGVNLTVQVTTVINQFIQILAKMGPIATTIDPVNGPLVDNALQITAKIMQTICEINVHMQSTIISHQ